LHNKPKAAVHPGQYAEGPKEEEEEGNIKFIQVNALTFRNIN
jgi:hypothetical protein